MLKKADTLRMATLQDFTDYRKYLKQALETRAKTTRGVRSRFAEALACRPGFITQVLDGSMNLSPDHASLANHFFGHTDIESEYFLLLVLKDRAGTKELRQQLDRQIEQLRAKHRDLQSRLKVAPKIKPEEESLFYSSWHYLAIMALITIPGFQTKERIAERLGLGAKRTSEALEHLLSAQLVKLKSGKYSPGTARTHLSKDSPLASKHHQNWRLQAMQSIERGDSEDFHYSSVITISEEDRNVLKTMLVAMVEDAAKVIAPSKEEKLCSFSIDFFEV